MQTLHTNRHNYQASSLCHPFEINLSSYCFRTSCFENFISISRISFVVLFFSSFVCIQIPVSFEKFHTIHFSVAVCFFTPRSASAFRLQLSCSHWWIKSFSSFSLQIIYNSWSTFFTSFSNFSGTEFKNFTLLHKIHISFDWHR